MRIAIYLLFACLMFSFPGICSTLYVPSQYPTIYAGIEASADGDSVVVADGIYTGYWNRNIRLYGKSITLMSENGSADCIIDCEYADHGFHIFEDETAETIIKGFTVRHGYREYAGGIYVDEASPTFYDVVVDCCVVESGVGAGMCISHSDSYFENCIVRNCEASNPGSYGHGGGINISSSNAVFNECVIEDNYVFGQWGYGGGIYCDGDNVRFMDCIIRGNSVDGSGWRNGGGLFIDVSYGDTVWITGCEISGNYVFNPGALCEGGGLFCEDGVVIVEDCLFEGNYTEGVTARGGGAVFDDTDGARVINCTFANNRVIADSSWMMTGAALLTFFCNIEIINTIFYNNSGDEDIALNWSSNITHCNFYGNPLGYVAGNWAPPRLGELSEINLNGDSCDVYQNIFLDPMFVDPVYPDYNLQWGSPCIDAGDPESPLDPDGTIADLGTYYFDQLSDVDERQGAAIPAGYELGRPYPNPFNSTIRIEYRIPAAGEVSVVVYDVTGRVLSELCHGWKRAGRYSAEYRPDGIAGGVYFVRFGAGDFVMTQKIVYLK